VRLLELEAFSVLTWEESNAFAKDVQLLPDAQIPAANDSGINPDDSPK